MGKPKLVLTRTKVTAYNNNAIVFMGMFTIPPPREFQWDSGKNGAQNDSFC